MRLTPTQARVILSCVRQQFGADAQVKLFGSRLDDSLRGGDVDASSLNIEPASSEFKAEFQQVCDAMGV